MENAYGPQAAALVAEQMRSVTGSDPTGVNLDSRTLEEKLVGPTGPLRNKATGLELTHPAVTQLMVEMALSAGFAPRSVLDPAAGFGNFLYEVGYRCPSVERLIGYEMDNHAATVARGRLWEWETRGVATEVREQDALLAPIERGGYDLVISNPPYVRVHRLGSEKQLLQTRYETATGRFDLYFLFYELATAALSSGGRLVMITSNKFMTTTAGAKLRQHLRSNYRPIRIVDFRDASPFRAAILACILVLEKNRKLSPGARWIELERVPSAGSASGIAELAEDPIPGFVRVPRLGADEVVAKTESHPIVEWEATSGAWHLNGVEGDEILAMLSSATRLGDLFPRLSVGIKSTADDVFIAPFDAAAYHAGTVERELLHPLLRGGSISRWHTTWDPSNGYDRYVLYPHEATPTGRTVAVSLDRYPKAKAFLEDRRERLASRDYVIAAGRRWYEIWVPQQVAVMTAPRKLVFPDFATVNTFALETSGAFVGSSAAFGVPRDSATDDDLWYALFLLNSPLYEYLHKRHFGTSILAKRYRYWTKHIARYPLPWPKSSYRSELAKSARDTAMTGNDPTDFLERAVRAFELTRRDETLATDHVRAWFSARHLGSARVARHRSGGPRPDLE